MSVVSCPLLKKHGAKRMAHSVKGAGRKAGKVENYSKI